MDIIAARNRPARAPFDQARLTVDQLIAGIDDAISDQLDAILKHPKLQRLEASWRGLLYLCEIKDNDEKIRIRVLNVPWAEICRDIDRSGAFDQTQLFLKTYEDEFGRPGGEPFGLILGDYQVSHRASPEHPDDVAALSVIGQVAAAAFAPFIVSAAPELLGLDRFGEMRPSLAASGGGDREGVVKLSIPSYLADIAHQPEYARWRALRAREQARFIGVLLPQCLVRGPYGDEASRREPFRYHCARDAVNDDDFLWMSAVYGFAGTVLAAFRRDGWFTDIRGIRRGEKGGGLVENLPAVSFATDLPGRVRRAPVEVEIDHLQERALDDLGLIPMLRTYGAPAGVFYSNTSLHSPPHFSDVGARSSARLSSMLQYMLCVSRFAHFIKVIGRDHIGSLTTADECRRMLEQWIFKYCTSDEEAQPAALARTPLRDARIEVREQPGQPGVFHCSAWLRPHFQLDQIMSAYEIVTDISPGQR